MLKNIKSFTKTLFLLAIPVFLYVNTTAQAVDSSKQVLAKEIDSAYTIGYESIDSAIVQLDVLLEKYRDNKGFYAQVLSTKAYFLANKQEYEESLRIGYEALEIQQKLFDTAQTASTLNRISRVNIRVRRFDEARNLLNSSLELYTMIKDTPHIANCNMNLGSLEQDLGNYDETKLRYKKAIDLCESINFDELLASLYYNMASVYTDEKDSFNRYILLSKEAFIHKTKSGRVPVLVNLFMTRYFINKGQYSKAVSNAQECLVNAEKMQNVEIALQAKKVLSEAYFENKQFKKAYETHNEYVDSKASLDSTNNVADIAEIEEKYKNAENEVKIAKLENLNLLSENSAQRYKLIALIISILGVIGGFLYYRKQQKIAIRDSELKAKLEEVKLSALRSQMNPHFLFNCINMAQNFIMDAKKRDAYEYLEKFAKLLRNVLDKSANFYIPIDEEIEQLALYLELESIRFKNGFTFSFEVDEELENGVYEIPGMVIQPFIENALIHGIYNREEPGGQVKVVFKKIDNRLNVVVEDNGVGREMAMQIKKQKDKRYQSVAIPNILERISIMKNNNLGKIHVEIEDLFSNSQPKGTLIKVDMPLN